jgi:hypothetical protein
MMRGILDSIAARLDEARDMLRYMTGLLVFLGLLGVLGADRDRGLGRQRDQHPQAGWRRGRHLRLSQEGLAAPLAAGIWFSSSLFGLAGSLVLGFLDLQTSQAQNRFYTELEVWLSTTVRDLVVERDPTVATPMGAAPSGDLRLAIERLREAIVDGGSNRAATSAMANLAEAIQGLVHHMRTEQQMIRDWVDSQAQQHREVRRLLEILVREDVKK